MTVTTIALTNKTKRIARPLHVWLVNLNVLIYGNACKNLTNVMEFLIVMMGVTNWDVVSLLLQIIIIIF